MSSAKFLHILIIFKCDGFDLTGFARDVPAASALVRANIPSVPLVIANYFMTPKIELMPYIPLQYC